MDTLSHCNHCQLPVGRLGLRREVGGEEKAFCCYGCCLAFQVHHGEREEPEAAALLIRLGVGAFLAMFIMLFSLLQYSGSLAGEAWLGRAVDGLMGLLATPLLAILGWPFLAGAWAAARSLSTFLYGVEIDDVAAFLWATAILVMAALLASAIPAVRAIRADPLTVLREE